MYDRSRTRSEHLAFLPESKCQSTSWAAVQETRRTVRKAGNNGSIRVAIATMTPGYLARVELSSTDIPEEEREKESVTFT